MKKNVLIVLGLLMMCGSFLPWYLATLNSGTVRFFKNDFMGLHVYSSDTILSFDGFPVVLGFILVVSAIFVGKIGALRTVGILSVALAIILALYDGIRFWLEENQGPQTAYLIWGYWLTLVPATVALIILIKHKNRETEMP